ncbi:potassium channel family protein [Alteraurantiacibacter aestuarii]|uniref:Two pore domain potassium channel family protein n=1 Tax=Alteraurantiacibacter aestuarii TaxID=650004 RepID=A0A844ZJT2_9SPHN|nr:ion channel [Alteraurantiacibacter aestuarii]MXO87532.1 two pore domain potassium channel family protein [Alteraurantiacibacter aestuarii]
MFPALAVATFMVLLTVIMHGLGLLGLARVLRIEREEEQLESISPVSARGIAFTLALVVGLFLLHGAEIWLYAAVYLVLDALPDLHTAVYFSTITYSTIGYDDAGLAHDWQLVAAIEGMNGIILMGWSTAFFVSLITRLSRK